MQMACQITSVKTIADRLKEERIARGWSQIELAEKAKVSQGTIGNVESGTRKQPRDLLKIAAALGVRAEWLQDGEEPKASTLEAHAKSITTLTAELTTAPGQVPTAPTAQAAPTLEQALEALGIALAVDMPDEVREDVADALTKLARRKGQHRDQQQVLQLLTEPSAAAPTKRTGT